MTHGAPDFLSIVEKKPGRAWAFVLGIAVLAITATWVAF